MENKKFLDILFENRNKAYGAYELRNTANKTLMKALFVGLGIVTLGMGGFVYSSKMDKIDYIENNKKSVLIDVIDIVPVKEDKVVEPPKEEEKPTEIKREQLDTKQVKFIVPTPTEKPNIEETVASVKETEKADLGSENREGTMESNNQVGGGDVSEGEKNVSGSQNNKTIDKGPETKVAEPRKAISARKAKVMAIFPGCEKEVKNGNTALTKCMSDKLSNELSYNLDNYAEIAQQENKTSAVAKMQFIVNKNGEITQVNTANGSDVTLGKEAKKALEKINKDLARKGKKIKPAKFDDGTDADLIFSIPVRFQFN